MHLSSIKNSHAIRPVVLLTAGDGNAPSDAVLSIPKSHPQAHKFAVSSVAWYPIDTGLFVSGGHDGRVKLWDSNSGEAAVEFELGLNVHAVAMSPVASSHCLIAAAGAGRDVQLCDAASGAFTHSLAGHR